MKDNPENDVNTRLHGVEADHDNEPPVYRISAFNLGTLLRDGPLAGRMRDACVKLLDEEMLYSLDNAPKHIRDKMSDLYPVQDFSFLIIDEYGVVHGYAVVSRYPADGVYYLADLKYERTEYLLGLWYICTAKVFKEIEPDGEFIVVAIEELKPIVDRLLAPVMRGIEVI